MTCHLEGGADFAITKEFKDQANGCLRASRWCDEIDHASYDRYAIFKIERPNHIPATPIFTVPVFRELAEVLRHLRGPEQQDPTALTPRLRLPHRQRPHRHDLPQCQVARSQLPYVFASRQFQCRPTSQYTGVSATRFRYKTMPSSSRTPLGD